MSGLELLAASLAAGASSAATAAAGAATSVGAVLATPAAQLLGTALTVGGTVASGMAAKEAAKVEQKQINVAATEEQAASQRSAEEERRRTQFVMSKQKAGAAASGGGVTGTILDIMSDTAAEGAYRENRETYLGATRSAGLRDKAAATGYKASADFTGTLLDAATTGIKGAYDYKKAKGYY